MPATIAPFYRYMRRASLVLLFFGSTAQSAVWHLDPEGSNVSFTSLKNQTLVEPHRFQRVTGAIDRQGKATLSIDLHSVETLIPIRNERMVKFLFDEQRYAVVTVELEEGFEQNMASERLVDAELSMNGIRRQVRAQMSLRRLDEDTILVFTQYPIIIQANSFAFSEGIEVLRGLAGLTSISQSVPVHLSLLFRR